MQKQGKIILPTRGQMFGDELTLLAGTALATSVSGNAFYCFFTVHGTYPNSASAGWNFLCAAGDYTFYVTYLKSNVSGIVDFYIDGVAVATGLDCYAASTTWNQVYSIAVAGLTAGRHTFKYIINGKNASSSAYAFGITKVHFKQATD
jgi:hypothetical protein